MSNSPPTNVVNSLKLVRDELLTTIEAAAKDIEVFFGNTQDGGRLQKCIDSIQQIAGTLSMLQMQGAHCLAENLLQVARNLTPGAESVGEDVVQAMTGGFFLLPRYLEFIESTQTDHPELLLPQINELRACGKQPPLADSHFFTVPQYPKSIESNGLLSAAAGSDVDRADIAGRLRHMYQIGLVALLQNKPIRPPLRMMSLALERLANLYSPEAVATLCFTASLALKTTLDGSDGLNKNRKLALVNLEKTLRRMIKIDPDGQSTLLPRPLTKEFVYWCAISGDSDNNQPAVDKLLSIFGVSKPGYDVLQLQKEADMLGGPSLSTIQSVVSVFEEEIETAKRMLELSAEAEDVTELGELEALLAKLAEILSVVGLSSASTRLKEQAGRVANMAAARTAPDRAELSAMADALLQIENAVVAFKRQAGYKQSSSEASADDFAGQQLLEAELIVLQEAENGLTLVKRELTAFAESNYNKAHLSNVAKTLTTIKGGMKVMHKSRCAAVLEQSQQFVEQQLLPQDHPSVLQQLLETFADTIISLEYYVGALQTDSNTDDSILQIAEESLAALGVGQ